MSALPIEAAPAPRPVLRVIHTAPTLSAVPEQARPFPAQDELPLLWPAARAPWRGPGERRSAPLPLASAIPRPEPFVAHAATLVTDVLVGARPATHLSRWASLDVQQQLARRTALRRAAGKGAVAPVRVTSTDAMVVAGTVVQVAVVFTIGGRAYAAALRLDFRHGRWLVTEVQSAC